MQIIVARILNLLENANNSVKSIPKSNKKFDNKAYDRHFIYKLC